MKKIALVLFIFAITISVVAQTKPAVKPIATVDSKFLQDKEAIKAMVGNFKVSFNFSETYSPDTGYKYHDRYREWGIESVFLVEESDKHIVLQHLLIINDTMIIKHWTQNWVYENTELTSFYKDNQWNKTSLKPEQVKGHWTQKVYSVDDSPRYEGNGMWIHLDGKHFWESVSDAPLPRREYTKRNDYNVLRRHSRIEINSDGWQLEQDNEKILRNNGIDKLLCWEKGMEKFTKGEYNGLPATSWWNKNKSFWDDVRMVWTDVYAKNAELKISKRVNNAALYEKLFELGDKSCKSTYLKGAAVSEIKSVIESFIKQS